VRDQVGVVTGLVGEIAAQGGWVFVTNGQVVNGANGQSVGAYAAFGPVWPDPNGADVWFLQSTPALLDFDRTTFLLKRSIPLPAASIGSGRADTESLIGLSSSALAFRTPESVCIVSVAP
jgi:hypothetical protein